MLGDVRATLWLALGEAYAARLDLGEANAYLSRALARFREQGDGAGTRHALREVALVRARLGDPSAIALAEEGIELQEEADPVAQALAQRLLARAWVGRVPAEASALASARELLPEVSMWARTSISGWGSSPLRSRIS